MTAVHASTHRTAGIVVLLLATHVCLAVCALGLPPFRGIPQLSHVLAIPLFIGLAIALAGPSVRHVWPALQISAAGVILLPAGIVATIWLQTGGDVGRGYGLCFGAAFWIPTGIAVLIVRDALRVS